LSAPILLIPIAIEWALLITTLAPVAFTHRFNNRPRLGLAIWFGSLLSAGLATGTALAVAVWSYFDTVAALEANVFGGAKWMAALAVSFGPWLVLLLSAISLVLVQTRLEPMVAAAKAVQPAITQAKRPLMNFMGVEVFTIDLPFNYAAADSKQLLISTDLKNLLSSDEFEAVLWHELGHIRGKHFALKRLARLVRLMSPGLAASTALVSEVERLCEIAADRFALEQKEAPALLGARAAFKDSSF
jgi:Zn-dependent protease with chaperone function